MFETKVCQPLYITNTSKYVYRYKREEAKEVNTAQLSSEYTITGDNSAKHGKEEGKGEYTKYGAVQ